MFCVLTGIDDVFVFVLVVRAFVCWSLVTIGCNKSYAEFEFWNREKCVKENGIEWTEKWTNERTIQTNQTR